MNTPPPASPAPQEPARPVPPPPADAPRAAVWVMTGLAVWGGLLAVGAALFQPSVTEGITFAFRPWRGVVVLACVGLFLGWWGWLLRSRRGR